MAQGNRHRERFIRVIYKSPILAKHGPLPHLRDPQTTGDLALHPRALVARGRTSPAPRQFQREFAGLAQQRQ
jgi:hypothetical protein